MKAIQSFTQCISDKEKQQRGGVIALNGLAWLVIAVMTVASMGVLLLAFALGWLINHLLAEYHVRRIQALGATVSPEQFPRVFQALEDVCQRFGVQTLPRVVILQGGESNALALRFARKKVVIILSEMLEGIQDDPARMRFLLAHEVCHQALDFGFRGSLELIKPARYRQARELTCDNAGLVCAGDVDPAKEVIRTLYVGKKLQGQLDEDALIREANEIYQGVSGWFLRQHLTHPPAGTRLLNIEAFAVLQDQSLASPSPHHVPVRGTR